MQKVSYMGNGSITEFYFNFPYFETSNVVVTKNGTPATGYNIIGNSGGLDADYPFIGGKVVFDIAPTSLESITIARQLPLARIADYQPLVQITPTTLNQDLNYLMEVIKDRKDELTDLTIKYSEIADKESTEIILARITAIHEEITDIDAKIRALGDISTLRTNVITNTNDITTLKGYDYVIESQTPTSQNNYTWYRKYKSGWVEQGGIYNSSNLTFAIEMVNTKYNLLLQARNTTGKYAMNANNLTTTGAKINTASSDWHDYWWYVCGIAQ